MPPHGSAPGTRPSWFACAKRMGAAAKAAGIAHTPLAAAPPSQAVQLLLKHGAPVDPVNKTLATPLHRAANNGHRKAVKALVAAGANLYARDKDGNSPLHVSGWGDGHTCMTATCCAGRAPGRT